MIPELRRYLTTRPAWEFHLWMGSLAASFAIIALAALPTVVWGWFVGVVLAAICAGLTAWALDLRRELATKEAECQRLHLLLTEAEISAPVPFVPAKPALRVVPAQRDGSEYEWPALAREIKHDEWTALMRAVEED